MQNKASKLINMISHNKKMALFLILAIFLYSIDRLFKIYALNYLESNSINLIGSFLQLKLAKNEFIAFSIPIGGLLIILISGIIVLFLIYYIIFLVKKQQIIEAGLLTIINFGAISNILDRLKYGYVVDYIDLQYFTVFNIADCMIVVGAILLIIMSKSHKA